MASRVAPSRPRPAHLLTGRRPGRDGSAPLFVLHLFDSMIGRTPLPFTRRRENPSSPNTAAHLTPSRSQKLIDDLPIDRRGAHALPRGRDPVVRRCEPALALFPRHPVPPSAVQSAARIARGFRGGPQNVLSESRRIVTGPSFTSSTSIIAPNSPVPVSTPRPWNAFTTSS